MLLAIEGPAGSGKSTLIEYLKSEYPDVFTFPEHRVTHDTTTQRAFTGPYADSYTILRDTDKYLTAAVSLQQQPNHIPVVDRFFLSGLVYTRILANHQIETRDPRLPMQYMRMVVSHLNCVSTLLQYRHPYVAPLVIPKVAYLFMEPPVAELETRRHQTGKEYPYSAVLESDAFSFVRYFFREHLEHTPFLAPHSIRGIDDPALPMIISELQRGEYATTDLHGLVP